MLRRLIMLGTLVVATTKKKHISTAAPTPSTQLMTFTYSVLIPVAGASGAMTNYADSVSINATSLETDTETETETKTTVSTEVQTEIVLQTLTLTETIISYITTSITIPPVYLTNTVFTCESEGSGYTVMHSPPPASWVPISTKLVQPSVASTVTSRSWTTLPTVLPSIDSVTVTVTVSTGPSSPTSNSTIVSSTSSSNDSDDSDDSSSLYPITTKHLHKTETYTSEFVFSSYTPQHLGTTSKRHRFF